MIRAAVLTVLIETLMFVLYGYRQKRFLLVVALANLLTNVTLNLSALLTALLCRQIGWPQDAVYIVIAAGEAAAVAVEYMIYEKYIANHEPEESSEVSLSEVGPEKSPLKRRRLFFQTLAANAVTVTVGLLITYFSL